MGRGLLRVAGDCLGNISFPKFSSYGPASSNESLLLESISAMRPGQDALFLPSLFRHTVAVLKTETSASTHQSLV